jgi:hypothetical protein
VVRELITKSVYANQDEERAIYHADGQPGSLMIEVINFPIGAQAPISPNRAQFVAIGFAVCFTLRLLILILRRGRSDQALAMLRAAAATGVAGAIIGGAIAFSIPSRYNSTATVCLHLLKDAGASNRLASEQLRQRVWEALSSRSLAELILKPELNLYPSERARRPMKEVTAQMRDDDLRIEPVDGGEPGGVTTAFTVSFEYPDPVKAQLLVQDLLDRLVEDGTWAVPLEVLDLPAVSPLPTSYSRLPITMMGLSLGLILGPLVEVLRRHWPSSSEPFLKYV